MSLADQLAEIEAPKGEPCKYARVLDALRETDDAVDEFDRRVMERSISGSAAAAALGREGHFVADTVVRKHVVGTCCCNR